MMNCPRCGTLMQGGDLPGVRIPDQPCQEKENDEEKHHSLYKDLNNGII